MEAATLSLLIVVVAVALFDFTNGFHDAADMVASAIASRAIRPVVAIAVVVSASASGQPRCTWRRLDRLCSASSSVSHGTLVATAADTPPGSQSKHVCDMREKDIMAPPRERAWAPHEYDLQRTRLLLRRTKPRHVRSAHQPRLAAYAGRAGHVR